MIFFLCFCVENKQELTDDLRMVSINEDGSVELATTTSTTSKTQKVKAVEAAAQVQKELCRQMFNFKVPY